MLLGCLRELLRGLKGCCAVKGVWPCGTLVSMLVTVGTRVDGDGALTRRGSAAQSRLGVMADRVMRPGGEVPRAGSD